MNNNFHWFKIKGIIQGFLLGFLGVWLFFYPFLGEIYPNPAPQQTTFITLFWDSLRILILIAYEILITITWIHLKQDVARYDNYKDISSSEIADEITKTYRILGLCTVSLAGGVVIIIQSIIDLF